MRELSISEFVAQLGEMALIQHEADRHALERAAKLVENRAKDKLGEYQGAVPPFAGWAELAESTKADRLRQGFPENEPGLRNGEMRDSIEHRVGDGEAHIGSDDDKLVWFEIGTAKQPPRSVLGAAAAEVADQVVGLLGETLKTSLVGEGVFQGRLPITGGG